MVSSAIALREQKAKARAQFEAALMPGLMAGDEACFTQLVNAYYGIMLHVARGLVGEAIADEVVQEAWVSVYRALPGFEWRSSLKTWILRITANEAKTRLRKESRTCSLDAMGGVEMTLADRFDEGGRWSKPPLAWHDEGPDALLINHEMGDCISLTFDHLPELQQTVFTLKDIEGSSFDEICNILDLTASNARVLLHRARTKLFVKIESFQETGEC